MEKVRQLLSKDRYARHSGIELVDVGPGTATVRMRIVDEHRNGVGMVHGGAIFTLADFAFAAAVKFPEGMLQQRQGQSVPSPGTAHTQRADPAHIGVIVGLFPT